MMKPYSPRRSRNRGVALIEAMVGILIFAFGVLGLVGLQASMTRAQTAAKYRADAGNMANELLGVMWTDAAANLPNYASGKCEGYARCKDWHDKLLTQLPNATTAVNVRVVAVTPLDSGGFLVSTEVQIELGWSQPGEQGAHSYRTLARVEL